MYAIAKNKLTISMSKEMQDDSLHKMDEAREEKEEQYRVSMTQNVIRKMDQKITELDRKVVDIHSALIGSELAKDGGIVRRMENVEDELKLVKIDMAGLKEGKKDTQFRVSLLWALAGGLGTGLLAGIIFLIKSIFFKK